MLLIALFVFLLVLLAALAVAVGLDVYRDLTAKLTEVRRRRGVVTAARRRARRVGEAVVDGVGKATGHERGVVRDASRKGGRGGRAVEARAEAWPANVGSDVARDGMGHNVGSAEHEYAAEEGYLSAVAAYNEARDGPLAAVLVRLVFGRWFPRWHPHLPGPPRGRDGHPGPRLTPRRACRATRGARP